MFLIRIEIWSAYIDSKNTYYVSLEDKEVIDLIADYLYNMDFKNNERNITEL